MISTHPRAWWAAIAPLLLLLLVGCSTWSETRTQVIDPIHALLHHELPDAVLERDTERLDALFAPSADATTRQPLDALVAGFSRVDEARGHIERVDLEQDPVAAWVTLEVEGLGAEGQPRSGHQEKQLRLIPGESGWQILFDAHTPFLEAPRPAASFLDEGALRGLWFQHETKRLPDAEGELQKYIFGSGVAAADLDNDGWDDVVLLTSERIDLFANRRGHFERVSDARGLGVQDGRVLTSVLPVDLDNDGWKDLFVGAELGQPLLFRNEQGRFRLVEPEDHGIETTERTIAAAAADFDGDGDVDLYLGNHDDVFLNAPDPPGSAFNAQADQLFRNEGGFRFRDITQAAGLGNTGWTLTPIAADYDADGDVDLFVGNDFAKDRLYRNDGSGRFEEISEQAGVDLPVAAMGADWGDYDGDGDLDLFVGGMFSGSGWVLEAPDFQIRRVPRVVDWLFRPYVREIVRSWFRGNRFYENRGDGTFLEISEESGAANSGWSWGTVWLDFDNDGLLDVYSLNGFLSGALEDDL